MYPSLNVIFHHISYRIDRMDNKIVSLLNNNLRVIIPNFGAFIIRQQDPRIVVFNEILQNNDGLLLDYYMKTEGVELDVAEQFLSEYTNYTLRQIESGKIVTIEGLGSLRKNKAGKIEFIQENEILLTNVLEIENPISATHEPVYIPEKEKPVTQNPRSKAQVLLRNHRVLKWIIIVLSANLLVILLFVVKDNSRNKFQESENSIILKQSISDQLADSMRAAAADTSLLFREGTSVPEPEEITIPVDGQLRYYIVAGCFRDEINADELVTSLKKSGYKAEKFGKIGELYSVSFASFDEKELAVKELARIREEFHPDAWMTRF